MQASRAKKAKANHSSPRWRLLDPLPLALPAVGRYAPLAPNPHHSSLKSFRFLARKSNFDDEYSDSIPNAFAFAFAFPSFQGLHGAAGGS